MWDVITYPYLTYQYWPLRHITKSVAFSDTGWCNGLFSQCYNTELTHWGRDKMAAIFQTTFSNAFSWMKMYEFRLRFHWSLFLRFQLTISQHWFRSWLGAVQATSHYLKQWWLFCRRICASLGLNQLMNPPVTKKQMHYDLHHSLHNGYSITYMLHNTFM